jgi:hypothetical protein
MKALPRFLFAIGWRVGDKRRPRCGITEPRRSAPASASTKPIVLPARRSAYKRCSVDCGVPQRRFKAAPHFAVKLFRSTGALWVQGFLLNREFSQERNSTECAPIIRCAASVIAQTRTVQFWSHSASFALPVATRQDRCHCLSSRRCLVPQMLPALFPEEPASRSSVSTTTPVATADTTDTRPGQP